MFSFLFLSGVIAGVNWVAADHEHRNGTNKKSVCKYVAVTCKLKIYLSTVCLLEEVNLLR